LDGSEIAANFVGGRLEAVVTVVTEYRGRGAGEFFPFDREETEEGTNSWRIPPPLFPSSSLSSEVAALLVVRQWEGELVFWWSLSWTLRFGGVLSLRLPERLPL